MSVPAPIPNRQGSGGQDSTKLSSSPTISIANSLTAPSSALYNFRLLEALRSDDPAQVQPFLDELRPSSSSVGGQEDVSKAGRLLGMAVRVASVPILTLILSSPNIPSPNLPVQPGSMSTPLHVASEIGRADAAGVLLNHPLINDTTRDDQGRTPLECAANGEVSSVIEDSRGAYQMRYLARLAGYIASPLSSADESLRMTEFLEQPRAEILNLNVLDEKSGTSLLHEAAKRRDLGLVELAVKRGADVFVRDRRGRRVLENEKGGDERIKVFLRQFSNQDSMVQSKGDGRPPDLRGFLSKWVNYRTGWRTRWFVLENGILSYYRTREDEAFACRGSIAMAVATIQPSSDGSRFEVHSRVSSSVPKLIVKSAHRAEIARWVQTIKLNIEYYSKSGNRAPSDSRTAPSRSASLKTTYSDKTTGPVGALPPSDQFLNPQLARSPTLLSGISAPPRTTGSSKRRDPSPTGTAGTDTMDDDDDNLSAYEAGDKDSVLGGTEPQKGSHGIPYESSFELGILNIKAQIELTQQLIDSIVTPPTSTTASPQRPSTLTRTPSRQQAVKDALRSSLATLATLITQQNNMSVDRERYLFGRIQREVEARRLWEENMLTVAQQQADMDRQLTEAALDNEKKRRALRQARGVLAGLSGGASLPTSPAPEPGVPSPTGILDVPASATSRTLNASIGSLSTPLASPGFNRASISNIQEVQDAIDAAGSDSEDGDDEFFDAIEANAIPNMKLYESIAHPDLHRPGTPLSERPPPIVSEKEVAAPTRGTIKEMLARKSLEPYHHVRNKLPLDDDKRPPVSLWSILKSSVGKDLTKISFPVAFNECTSMLQRMAEDMEYDACLTVAASEQDSLKRIAFVGAFAMSNYSSTIGRIAKPFNPLLSQSFEYAIPNRYRYISEQVSHHPPISACYSEAPSWKYYGEVDAQNKFQGRSFEIKPTGVAHADLIIPKAWAKAPGYPDAGPEYGEGLVAEHYSWKKVTTNVSNFIMGNPIIDHYGDLIVTNHRTGETCTLTFKPRGWRGKDAFEIKGSVLDSEGNTAWDIAGRWDTQLVARRAGAGSAPLEADAQFKESQKEYLLLWRNSEKPKAPFNLTPFAVTLNDIPSGLKDYLCPTDCRLRTDQRAFENAEYERAQALKTANEEKQRITRKLRAEGKIPPHEPRWFEASTDPDGGDRLWVPKRVEDGEVRFWAEREKAPETQWAEVDHIFAED
ncbi:putative Oxysterol-binding protein [Naematelia encephala]|uniref:Putative Oxysterol-binding protein n=1 Tax=Naematelia encephala TaxID=71784 RepID=A0A1Y2AVX9_9TREE|nr:putative Oxysterol-binding protein [Naematelia encephala]